MELLPLAVCRLSSKSPQGKARNDPAHAKRSRFCASMSDQLQLDWSHRGLTKLPENIGQQTALQKLNLSRASACAELRCCCGPWTVEVGER